MTGTSDPFKMFSYSSVIFSVTVFDLLLVESITIKLFKDNLRHFCLPYASCKHNHQGRLATGRITKSILSSKAVIL